MDNPLTQQKEKRQLNYLKCRFCRQSKKKCEPVQRKWPGQKCNRCLEEGLECSENQRAQGRAGANVTSAETDKSNLNSSTQDLGTAEWKEYYSLSLRVAWLQHVKRYMQSLAPFGLDSHDQYFHLPLIPDERKYDDFTASLDEIQAKMQEEEESISQQIVSLLSAARSSQDGPVEPLKRCLSRLLFEIKANHGTSKSSTYPIAPDDAFSKLVDGYVDSQDFATALLMQESIVLGLHGLNNSPMNRDRALCAVIRYCEIYASCQKRLSEVCPNGWHLQAAVPPMHALLSLSRDASFLSLLPGLWYMDSWDLLHRTLLHLALDLKLDGIEKVDHLLKFAGSLDSNKRLPLHISCLNGQMSTSSALIRIVVQSGDVDSKDWRGRTPLHIASAKGHAALVMRLLESGADIHAVDRKRRTPLYYAIAGGQVSTTTILQKATPWQDWSTFLRPAIESGNPAVVGIIKDMTTTPLSEEIIGEALERTVENGPESFVDFLLGLYSDINRAAYELYKDRLLRYAATSNKANIVALLIHKHNAEVDSRDQMGWTSLMRASYSGLGDVASVLLSSGSADVNSQNINGNTSLHLAAWGGHGEIVRILLDHGADVNRKDSNGSSPLFDAVRHKNLDVVKMVLERGADVQLRDGSGKSPLDLCLAAENPERGIIYFLEKYAARDDMVVESDSAEMH